MVLMEQWVSSPTFLMVAHELLWAERGVAMEINTVVVRECLAKGGAVALELFRGVVDERVSQECELVFEQAIDVGIENTVRALMKADVGEATIVTALHEVWGLSRKEAASRLVWVKRTIAVELLDELLMLKGLHGEEVKAFHRDYAVASRLRHEAELLELWDDPAGLYSSLMRSGKDPLPSACPSLR